MSCVWMLQRGHSGDGCVLASTLCKYDLRKGFGCVAMGSALLFIVRSRLLVYSAGSGVNKVQVVLSGFSKRFVLSRQKLCVGMVVCISWLHSWM